FVHRSARWLMTYETSWTARDTPITVRAGREWLAELHATMQDRGKGVLPQAYQNFLDPALKDWAHAYYGEALPKLRRIKRTYDPDRFFDFPHAIPA
ncbi:BBE domain-containing protein, partial [Streptomyces sp. NPDC089915]|uniref:BBE domain-containing protein n=1 Tax=Streptomyces sp. NPDC089915 TaxID=3155186 RepID=UPI00343AE654